MAAVHSPLGVQKFTTRKSHKTQLRDRSHGVLGISKQGGGKANWGKPLDDLKYLDESLPDVSDQDERTIAKEEELFLRVSEETERQHFAQSIKDLDRFKETVKQAARDYIAVQDSMAFCRVINGLDLPLYHQDISYVIAKLGMDQTDLDRKHLAQLLVALHTKNVVTPHQLSQGFRKLANQMDDVLIDAPLAKQYFAEFCTALVAGDAMTVEMSAELASIANPDPALVSRTKEQSRAAVSELFRILDIAEFKRAVSELPCASLHFETIKILISRALDADNSRRELASKALAEISGVLVKREAIERAFTVLLERVEDLYLDVPDILALLSCFIARAVSDEALSPAFLLRVDLFASDMGFRVLSRAQHMLQLPHKAELLERVWVDLSDDEEPGPGSPTAP